MLAKIKRWAKHLTHQVLAIWVAARDPRTRPAAKFIAVLTAAYAFSPIDLIPDFIPILGYIDDLIIVPLGIAIVIKLIPTSLMEEFKRTAIALEQAPKNYRAAACIVILWVLATACVLYFFSIGIGRITVVGIRASGGNNRWMALVLF